MKFAYIDESGVINGDSDYFNISILVINNEKDLRILKNTVKKFRRGKYKKQLKNVKEIKAYQSDEKLIKDLLKALNRIEFKTYSLFYDNKKNNLKNHTVNEIYRYLVLELLKLAKLDNIHLNLFIDKFLPKRFEEVFINDIMKFLKNKNSNVSCENSENSIGIQFVDLVSWSTFQYLERDNKICMRIIENKCILTEFNKKREVK